MRYFKCARVVKDTFESLKEQKERNIEAFKESFNVDFKSYTRNDGPIITANNNEKIKLKSHNLISKATKEGKTALKWWDENIDTSSLTLERVIKELQPEIKEQFIVDGWDMSGGINKAAVRTGLGIREIVAIDDLVYFATDFDEIRLNEHFDEISEVEFKQKAVEKAEQEERAIL